MSRRHKGKSQWNKERHNRYRNAGIRKRNAQRRAEQDYRRCNEQTDKGLRFVLDQVADR